jgi:hypothetical protein
LFPDSVRCGPRLYANGLTATVNNKGVMDVDTVKGCALGMKAYPLRGCYGDCYAARTAAFRGFDFSVSVNRRFSDREHLATVRRILNKHSAGWFRVGVSGDPSHDWAHTVHVLKYLWPTGKIPVIVTKHWLKLTDEQIHYLRHMGAVVHTSTSGMDTEDEVVERLGEFRRLVKAGIKSLLRVVSCSFGDSEWGRGCLAKQKHIIASGTTIDTPFRPSVNHPRVLSGEIFTEVRSDSVGGKRVSLSSPGAYLGKCSDCPDQCGVERGQICRPLSADQHSLFPQMEVA